MTGTTMRSQEPVPGQARGVRSDGLPVTLPHANAWLGFLADDERVTRNGPESLEYVRRRVTGSAGPAELSRGCNLLALLLFRRRRVEEARNLCRRQIRFACRQSDRSLLLHAFQAQINILRIEGFTGDVDAALRGLAALEPLAAGRPARLPELEIDTGALDALRDAGHPLAGLALSIRVVDTCKILWRRGLVPRLLAESGRLLSLWPHLARGAEPHHAAEAPWVSHPLACGPGTRDWPADASLPPWRLRFITGLHEASEAAHAGLPTAGRLAGELFERRDSLAGEFLSPLTRARCHASLGDTLLRTGRRGDAAAMLRDSLAIARAAGDGALARDVLARLTIIEPDALGEPGQGGATLAHADEDPTPADDDLTLLTSVALSRLGEG